MVNLRCTGIPQAYKGYLVITTVHFETQIVETTTRATVEKE